MSLLWLAPLGVAGFSAMALAATRRSLRRHTEALVRATMAMDRAHSRRAPTTVRSPGPGPGR